MGAKDPPPPCSSMGTDQERNHSNMVVLHWVNIRGGYRILSGMGEGAKFSFAPHRPHHTKAKSLVKIGANNLFDGALGWGVG